MSEINNIKTSNSSQLNTTRNSKADVAKSSATNGAEGQPVKADDKVSFTDTASQLESLRQTISDTPEVNAARVEAVKAAIAEGSYSIDSDALAQAFTKFENQL